MNAITAYRQASGVSQSGIAERIRELGFDATQGLISQWEKNPATIPFERCIQLERATQGGIRCEDLRDDVIWNRKGGQVVGYTINVAA